MLSVSVELPFRLAREWSVPPSDREARLLVPGFLPPRAVSPETETLVLLEIDLVGLSYDLLRDTASEGSPLTAGEDVH